MISTLRPRLRHERGSVLVELLVAIPCSLAVCGGILAVCGVFAGDERGNANRTQAMEGQQVATARMTRDIRQAESAVVSPDQRQLTIETYVNGAPAVVVYTCTPPRCTRTVGGGAPETVLQDVESFTFTQTGNHVGLTAKVKIENASVELSDGAALLNAES